MTRLRAYRIRKAPTQRELAEFAGVSRETVARIEELLDELRPATIRKLARAQGVAPHGLMGPLNGER